MTPEEERQLAVDLFNRTWTLLELPARTPEQGDELIDTAHASSYHWLQVGTAANRARSQWQLSRVYVVLGRPEPALYHAQLAHDQSPLEYGHQHARAGSRQDDSAQQAHQQPRPQAADRQDRPDRHDEHAGPPRDAVGGIVRLRDGHHCTNDQ